MIEISDHEVEQKYNENKEDSYKIHPARVVEYVYWNVDYTGIDSLYHTEHKDSIMDITYIVMDEANISDLASSIKLAKGAKLDTMELTLEYDNLSGVPYTLGANRGLVRFAHDNPIGTISDIIQVKDGHVICQVVGETEGGYKSLEGVKASIESQLRRDKKMDYAKSLLASAQESAMSTADLANNNDLIK